MVSTRRSQSDEPPRLYKVGDKVEIVHGKSVAIGILLAKTEDKSMVVQEDSSPITTLPDTHWIVRTEDNEEQSIPERLLRSITDEGSHENNSSLADSDEDTSSERRSSPSKKSTKPTITKAKKSVVFVSRKGAISSNNKKTVDNPEKIHTTRAATRSSGNAVGLFKGIEEIVLPPKPRPASKASTSNDNVIKIPMLTGTLFMYKGPKRRVKFVRSK
ncbi:hypothetical protein FisN_15Lh079 [Fistulifera solaris]|uniref:Uncharacterized protein n=1 Tax=Fistulifera solaris TaxID=1519565 RepID=A0A1Z5KAT9_FISSO|nr:hypothetical protein FisN_15Lh079 [Fistulifera solaris]|eukprot:GAX23364.1 hypothetical protein FisN_15Lh079 [Fistulifera solaris]